MNSLERRVMITKENIDIIFDYLLSGDVEVIENSAILGVEFALHMFMEYSKRRGVPLIVEDIFDTLPVYLTHLRFLGVNFEDLDMKVIKVGGSQDAGNVVARVRFETDPLIYQRKIDQKLQKIIPDGKYIHLVLGLERLLSIQNNPHMIRAVLSSIRQKLGEKDGMSVYILEKPLAKNPLFNPLPMLEDLATSVIELVDEGAGIIGVYLKKSRLALLMNTQRLLISPRDVVGWWE
ncbi:hypothetical protein TEU_04700 [Thermococcus eurythermalis]|uniref:Uncharacterized protein n=1 Tax=Thermococcus eurythermalis TaxID=1505907 RepID=A0A097QT98_9EURY|nr:DUF257 family protein [Thermococcus eurythermalis]AIU69688.1 hypothetical protein TEU_04700 [Thermococcus eurythermalis]